MLKLALTGLPAAGKSTTAQIAHRLLEANGYKVARLKIARPLYDVQKYFYDRMGISKDTNQQDGILLNFLGSHFRKIAPDFLKNDLQFKVSMSASANYSAVICEDARPADLEWLDKEGFTIIHIIAPEDIRRKRKALRGDLTSGDDNHPTEQGLENYSSLNFQVIDNSENLSSLEISLAFILSNLSHDTNINELNADYDVKRLLFDQAVATIRNNYVDNRHQIASALMMGDGNVFTGIHIEAMVGRASICAEAVALGKAVENQSKDIRFIISVRHPKPSEPDQQIRVVPPCGLCRELLLDYGREAQAIIDDNGSLKLVSLSQLLPNKYVGTKWNGA